MGEKGVPVVVCITPKEMVPDGHCAYSTSDGAIDRRKRPLQPECSPCMPGTPVAPTNRVFSASVACRVLVVAAALLVLPHSLVAADTRMVQLGLYPRPGDAWWTWRTVEQRFPDLAKRLTPFVAPLDPKRPEADAALRARVAGDMDTNAFCRKLLGAGIGCLEIEAGDPAPSVRSVEVPPAKPAPIVTAPSSVVAVTNAVPIPALTPPPLAPVAPAPAGPTGASAAVPVPTGPAPHELARRVPILPLPRPSRQIASGGAAAPTPGFVPILPRSKPLPGARSGVEAPAALVVAEPPAARPTPAPAEPVSAALGPDAPVNSPPALSLAAANPAEMNIPAMALTAVVPSILPEGLITYKPDEARTMADIDRRSRRQGRLGAVLPAGGFKVSQAALSSTGINYCALTLDDGPHRSVTRRILDILAAEAVKVTYFPIGKPAQLNGQIIRDFVADGHEVGNHSLTHADLRAASPESQRHEIEETNRILRSVGADPKLFRPPYGRYNDSLLHIARELGMSTVLWNVDTRDWQVRDPDKIVQHVHTAAGTGSVLLLHSTYPTTASALPRVIADLKAKGCQFVTLSQWIERMRQLAEPPMVAAGTAN